MDSQLWFDGFDPPPPKPREHGDPLFFAVLPEAAAAQQMVELALALAIRHAIKTKPTAAERLHVSIRGAILPRRTVGPAAEALAEATRIRQAPFQVSFDRVMSFKARSGNRPLVLTCVCEQMQALQRQAHRAMRQGGLDGPIGAALTPHVTLLRDREIVPEQQVDPITWTVREVVLVHSVWGEARHRVLRRWPLRE